MRLTTHPGREGETGPLDRRSAFGGSTRTVQTMAFAVPAEPGRSGSWRKVVAKRRSSSVRRGITGPSAVSHPGQLTASEIARIDEVLINDVIKNLTGCACLSGTIDVIWERNFERVLDVRLG